MSCFIFTFLHIDFEFFSRIIKSFFFISDDTAALSLGPYTYVLSPAQPRWVMQEGLGCAEGG